MTLETIELQTKAFADARAVLAERVRELDDELTRIKRQRLRGIKAAIATAAARQDELQAAIETAPALFEAPKTRTFYGIRVGYMKGRGALLWDDSAKVCTLIRKHLPDQADTLIKTTEKPLKGGLNTLSTAELRRIGVQAVESGECVVIKPVDSEIDKLVDALLESALEAEGS